jgi:SAM-dependent methyltransferase
MIWYFERRILDALLRTLYAGTTVTHLDFACGTGRILKYCSGRAIISVGVDLSPSMLAVARRYNRAAEIIEADLTREDVLGDRKFNFVTAFRFFAQAQPELRREAMRAIVRHLHVDGYVVFNNHMNTGSTRGWLVRLLARRSVPGMSMSEVKGMLDEAGLEVVRSYPLSILPASDSHTLLPLFLLRRVEAMLSGCWPLQSLGENIVLVCRLLRPAARGDGRERGWRSREASRTDLVDCAMNRVTRPAGTDRSAVLQSGKAASA